MNKLVYRSHHCCINNNYCIDHKCVICSHPRDAYMIYCNNHRCCNISCLNTNMDKHNINILNYIANEIININPYYIQYYYTHDGDTMSINIDDISNGGLEILIKTYDTLTNLLRLYKLSNMKYCVNCFIDDVKYIINN